MAEEVASDHASTERLAIEPDEPLPDDEGYAGSSTSSFVSTIESEIRRGISENGRLYASHGKNKYFLPVDEYEMNRIDLNHCKYTLAQNDKLFLAPLPSTVQKILDVGTGTGIFAIDVAEVFPSSQVIGTDIAHIQPPWVPPNCVFEIDDAEDDWLFDHNSFDYIHARDLYHSIRDWDRLIRQAFETLKPGGYLELACIWPVPMSDDNTLSPDSAYVDMCMTFQRIAEKIGAAPDAPIQYKQRMIDAGFTGVTESKMKIPSTPWPKDRRLKKIGALELANVIDGAQAFLLRGFTQEFGRSREELELLLMQMRKELMSQKMHSYVTFIAVYGQKPGGNSEVADSMPQDGTCSSTRSPS